MAIAFSFFNTGATCSIIKCVTFTEIGQIQAYVLLLLEKSPLALNGHSMPIKGKVIIQSAFDVEYCCVIEHSVYFSESNAARINVLGRDSLARTGEFNNLRNPMLILTVFTGKRVKLSLYLGKPSTYFSQFISVEMSHGLVIAPYSTRVSTLIAIKRKLAHVPKEEQFPSTKKCS